MVGRPTHLEVWLREQVFGDGLDGDDENPTEDRTDDRDEDTDDSAKPRIPNDQTRDDEGNFA